MSTRREDRRVQRPISRLGASAPAGLVGGVLLVGVVALVLVPFREELSQAAPALALVLPVVVAAAIGGTRAAAAIALVAALALNLAFLPPYGNPEVAVVEDVIALVVFLAIALALGTLVAVESERLAAAEERAAELEMVNRELAALSEDRERLQQEANRIQVLEQVDEQRSALLR